MRCPPPFPPLFFSLGREQQVAKVPQTRFVVSPDAYDRAMPFPSRNIFGTGRHTAVANRVQGSRLSRGRVPTNLPRSAFFFFLHSLLRTTALGSETSCNQLLFIFEPQLFFGVLWLCRSSSPPPPPLAGPGGGGARLSRPNPKNLAVSGGGVILFCPIVSVKITWEI